MEYECCGWHITYYTIVYIYNIVYVYHLSFKNVYMFFANKDFEYHSKCIKPNVRYILFIYFFT